MIHSPFHVIPEFFSPAFCEQVIKELGIRTPSYEVDEETPIPNIRLLADTKIISPFKQALGDHAEEIAARYNGEITGMDEPRFYQHFENPKKPCVSHGCENARLSRKKWVKVKDVDLVGFVWLKDYNGNVPLDPSFEVYGGKLEFPAYNFSILPERGTCVIFPAGPHFITAISHVFAGTSEYIKFSLKLVERVDPETGDVAWFYQPQNFPGTYQEWFV